MCIQFVITNFRKTLGEEFWLSKHFMLFLCDRAFLYKNFLTEEECDHLMALVSPCSILLLSLHSILPFV